MSKLTTKLHGYNLLLTKNYKKDITIKDIYDAHLWIDNGIIKKNHTTFDEEELDSILDNFWNNEGIFYPTLKYRLTIIIKKIKKYIGKLLNQNKDERFSK
jgi:hypothetical protein